MSKFNELINGSCPVLIDFFAEWCSPCHTMSPILKEVKSHYGNNLKIIKINIDKNQQVTEKFQVRGVPTFILFKQGELLWKQSGLIEKSNFINKIDPFI